MSNLSGATTNVTGDAASDCNSNNSHPTHAKCARYVNKVYATKFKGVLALPNGHWGAQMYSSHQRIWLGTFKSEMEAAMAYDSAAIVIRNGDSYRNIPWSNITAQEPKFQSQFSKETVLHMIKDGSYQTNFAYYLQSKMQEGELEAGRNLLPLPVQGSGHFLCRRLFQKELTPSDVGKLNRLVIPKKHALKYFPNIPAHAKENESGAEVGEVQLDFYDHRTLRPWKFRYCYWKSSQSFVFTRGWNKFVKEKGINSRDTIIFSMCEGKVGDNKNEVRVFFVIDVAYYNMMESNNSCLVEEEEINVVDKRENDGQQNLYNSDEVKAEKDLFGVESANNAHETGFKLFGVQIN